MTNTKDYSLVVVLINYICYQLESAWVTVRKPNSNHVYFTIRFNARLNFLSKSNSLNNFHYPPLKKRSCIAVYQLTQENVRLWFHSTSKSMHCKSLSEGSEASNRTPHVGWTFTVKTMHSPHSLQVRAHSVAVICFGVFFPKQKKHKQSHAEKL